MTKTICCIWIFQVCSSFESLIFMCQLIQCSVFICRDTCTKLQSSLLQLLGSIEVLCFAVWVYSRIALRVLFTTRKFFLNLYRVFVLWFSVFLIWIRKKFLYPCQSTWQKHLRQKSSLQKYLATCSKNQFYYFCVVIYIWRCL